MRIEVRVKTRAKADEVVCKNGIFFISIKAIPIQGEANKAIIKLLSRHFKTPQSAIQLKLGTKNKIKVYDVQV